MEVETAPSTTEIDPTSDGKTQLTEEGVLNLQGITSLSWMSVYDADDTTVAVLSAKFPSMLNMLIQGNSVTN